MFDQPNQPHHLNKGLAATILVVVLLAAGVTIWFFWQKNKESATSGSTSVQTNGGPATSTSADEDKAVNLVRAQPEVLAWLNQFPGANKERTHIEVDHEENGVLTVQVYEILNGHTNTQGWYSVDTKTWKVTKDL